MRREAKDGEPRRNRTYNPQIKSLACQRFTAYRGFYTVTICRVNLRIGVHRVHTVVRDWLYDWLYVDVPRPARSRDGGTV